MLGYFQPNYYGGIRKCMIIELICPTNLLTYDGSRVYGFGLGHGLEILFCHLHHRCICICSAVCVIVRHLICMQRREGDKFVVLLCTSNLLAITTARPAYDVTLMTSSDDVTL